MQGKVNNPKVLLHREADIRFVIVNFVHLELFSSHSETNMGFDMSCCSFFIVNFADLKLFFFTLFFFYLRMKKLSCIQTSLAFLVSKMGLTTLLAQLVSVLKAKFWKVDMRKKNILFFKNA